jgi:hypothetical protein
MIRLQIVDLFPKQQRPEVLAEELDAIERRGGPGRVAGESAPKKPIS